MNRIGLIDVDNTSFPNLALGKIARYHKEQGDSVEWVDSLFGGGLCNTITSVQKDNLVVEYIAQPIKRERTEEEKLRRHLHGDKGAKFSKGKQMAVGSDGIMNTITSVYSKDNLIMEAMIQDNEVVLKKERTSKTRPKGKGWEYVQFDDGRRGWVRLRKLTPRECFRLMGVTEENINKLLNAGISDSQLYKLAGNSIVVQCMAGIFRNAFSTEEVESMTLF